MPPESALYCLYYYQYFRTRIRAEKRQEDQYMDWTEACESLKKRMFALAGCSWQGEVSFREGGTLRLQYEPQRLTVEAPDLSAAGRGLSRRPARSGTAGRFRNSARSGISRPAG